MSRMAYEELLLSPVGALARYRDADARPLCGEAIVDDPDFRAGLELRRCPYPGSRRHHERPMNVSALKQMTRHWPAILGTAQLLRDTLAAAAAAAAAGPDAPARRRVHLVRAAHAAVCLPLYLLYRAASPLRDGEVPGFVSGLHKASIDIATGAGLALLLAHRGDASRGGLLELAEHHGLLIGAAGVCAGPPHMIDELLGVLSGERTAPPEGTSRAARALGDLAGLAAYAEALLELAAARQLAAAYLRRRVDALVERCAAIAAAEPGAREPTERLGDAVARHPVPTRPSEIIQRQDRVLRELPAASYAALLELAAHHRAAPSPSGAAGLALLAHARGGAPPDPAEVRRVLAVADRRAGEPWTAAVAEAIVDTARLQQLALAAASAIEAAIRRALDHGGPAPPLSPDHLARVFGTSPARYLGDLVGIEVTVTLSPPR